jgi:hypothetical protein
VYLQVVAVTRRARGRLESSRAACVNHSRQSPPLTAIRSPDPPRDRNVRRLGCGRTVERIGAEDRFGRDPRNGPGRNRTCDLGIKSPLLCQLSYRPRLEEYRRATAILFPPPPSTSGPGHSPFKAVARVRIPLGAPGRLAQLGERLVYTQEVGGSIPSPPIFGRMGCAKFAWLRESSVPDCAPRAYPDAYLVCRRRLEVADPSRDHADCDISHHPARPSAAALSRDFLSGSSSLSAASARAAASSSTSEAAEGQGPRSRRARSETKRTLPLAWAVLKSRVLSCVPVCLPRRRNQGALFSLHATAARTFCQKGASASSICSATRSSTRAMAVSRWKRDWPADHDPPRRAWATSPKTSPKLRKPSRRRESFSPVTSSSRALGSAQDAAQLMGELRLRVERCVLHARGEGDREGTEDALGAAEAQIGKEVDDGD